MEKVVEDLKKHSSEYSKYLSGFALIRLEKYQEALELFLNLSINNGICPLEIYELSSYCLLKL